jgi:hypothetical protein
MRFMGGGGDVEGMQREVQGGSFCFGYPQISLDMQALPLACSLPV